MTVLARVRTYGSLVAFSHTVFALPFAASAVVLSLAVPHAPLGAGRASPAMLACMVCARTSAMAFNRWADRDVDARNPRTRMRHVPAGHRFGAGEALALAAASGRGVPRRGGVARLLARDPGAGRARRAARILVCEALHLGSSRVARRGARAGARRRVARDGRDARRSASSLLMLAVVTWLLGFDVLYSLQDEALDREAGLRSIPARFGTRRALGISAGVARRDRAALAGCGLALHRGPAFAAAVATAAALLVYEHNLVRRKGLSAIDRAFFDVNAWVSVAFFGLVLADEGVRRFLAG